MYRFIFAIIFFHSTLFAGIPITGDFNRPTERLIKRESWERVKRKLQEMKVPSDLFPFFDSIAEIEDWGHIGYHGANQGYRVYQDVIRFTVEEILEIRIRKNFHFLRVPGDADLNLNSMEEFVKYWSKIDNKNDTRSKQLLSLNFGIYSNFDERGSCSLYLFVKDKSKTSIDYPKQLAHFFNELGIPVEELQHLFAIGRRWLDEEGGIMLQLSEFSHVCDPNNEAYNFADTHGYPAKKGGHRYGTYPLSNHFERMETDLYLERKLDIAPQLRLLINNRYTLNPYSYLVVRR
ncbi:MAG TPA: hypothetical protein VIH61_09865, partial [Waddliaceae bacterium]